jgi:plastocyanin
MRTFLLVAPFLLCAGSAAGQPVAAPVQGIALYSYGYNPDPIVLAAGKAVTINFVNRATKGHDFTATKFFRSSRIISGNVGEGEVDLGPGQSASVTLVPAAGRYKVHCGRPFHKMMGMNGDIVVR